MNMGKVKRISVLMRKIKLVYDLNFNSMQNSYNTILTVSIQNYYILDVFDRGIIAISDFVAAK